MPDNEPAEASRGEEGKGLGSDAVAPEPPSFAIQTGRRGKESFVELSGELDLSTAPQLRETLVAIISEDRPRRLVLDLSNLIYLDSTGLSVFVTAHQRAGAESIEFSLANPNASIRRLLQITALDQVFVIVDEDGSVLPPLPPRDHLRDSPAPDADESNPTT
jgi:anti-sigma B factor antagonist